MHPPKIIQLNLGLLIILILLFYPLFPFWQLMLGKYFLKSQNSKSYTFTILAHTHLLLAVIVTIFPAYLILKGLDPKDFVDDLRPLLLSFLVVWQLSVLQLSYIAVKWEIVNTNDEYKTISENVILFVKGFFFFNIWPLAIYYFGNKMAKQDGKRQSE